MANHWLPSLDQDSLDVSLNFTMHFDLDITYLGDVPDCDLGLFQLELEEVQTAMILVQLESRLVIVHGLIPSIALESDMTYLSAVLLRSRKTLDARPQGMVDHLENFGVDQVQLWILKLQRWYHVLGVIGFEFDAILFGFVQLLKKSVMKPSTSIQCFS
jgi:hypothetical protein